MKVLRRAEQKNFRVDVDFYTEKEIEIMLALHFIDKPFADYDRDIDRDYTCVYACDCSKIEVVYDNDYGCYKNVVTLKDSGEQINVLL